MGKDIVLGDEMKRPQISDDILLLSKLAIFFEESTTDSLEMEHDSTLMFHVSEFLDGPLLSINATSMERSQLSDETSLLSMLAIFTEESISDNLEMEHDSALMFHVSEFLDGPPLSINSTSMERPQLSDDGSLLSMLAIFTEGSSEMEDELLFHASEFLLSHNAASMELPQFSADCIFSECSMFSPKIATAVFDT